MFGRRATTTLQASLREQLLVEYGGHAPEDYMKLRWGRGRSKGRR